MTIDWTRLPQDKTAIWEELESFADTCLFEWPEVIGLLESLVEALRVDKVDTEKVQNLLAHLKQGSRSANRQNKVIQNIWYRTERVIRESCAMPSQEICKQIEEAGADIPLRELELAGILSEDDFANSHKLEGLSKHLRDTLAKYGLIPKGGGEPVDDAGSSEVAKVRIHIQYHTLGVIKTFATADTIGKSDYMKSLLGYLSRKDSGAILNADDYMKSTPAPTESMRRIFRDMCARMEDESVLDQSQVIDEATRLLDDGKLQDALEYLEGNKMLVNATELQEAVKSTALFKKHFEDLRTLLTQKNKLLRQDVLYSADVVRIQYEQSGPACKKKSQDAASASTIDTLRAHQDDRFYVDVIFHLSKCKHLSQVAYSGNTKRELTKVISKQASSINKCFSEGKASAKVVQSLLRKTGESPKNRHDIDVLVKTLVYEMVHNGVIMPGSKLTTYRPFPVITQRCVQGVTDNAFDLDPLFDAMTIQVEAIDGTFGKQWKLLETADNCELVEEVLLVNRSSERGMALSTFKSNIITKHPNLAIVLEEVMGKQHIDSTEQLMAMTEDDLKVFRSASVGLALAIEAELERLVGSASTRRFLSDEATVHNIRRLIAHRSKDIPDLGDTTDLATLSWLSPEAVEKALRISKRKYYGERLLTQVVNDFFVPYTERKTAASKAVIDVDRGLLLHGPPGTGKSAVNNWLPECSGIILVAPPMSSGELARPYVGQTEKAIKMFCERALLAPWLLFGWVVDETDSMAPKRTASGEDKNASKLATFLSVIGGSGNVPNIVILGATNRLESMDDAVLRRLSGQFYVGRPNYSCRKFFLTKDLVRSLEVEKTTASPKPSPDQQAHLTLTEGEIEDLVHMTMNFSGASMKKLTMRIYLLLKNTWARSPKLLTDGERTADLLAVVLGVCDQMRVTVSGVRLPNVIKTSGGRNFTSPIARGQLTCSKFLKQSTRRILIDARDAATFTQLTLTVEEAVNNGAQFTSRVLALRPKCKVEKCGKFAAAPGACRDGGDCDWMADLSTASRLSNNGGVAVREADVALVPDVLRELVFFADEIGVSNFTLLDRQYLQEKGCFDESKALEELQSVFRERKFAPSLVLMDLDSIGGISVSQSTGSMGSMSYNVSYPHILNAALAEFRRARVVEAGGVLEPHWIVSYMTSEVVHKTFVDTVPWPPTRTQSEKKKQDDVDRSCTACGYRFKEKDNKPDACKYHPGSILSKMPDTEEQVIVPGPLEDGFDGDVTLLGIDEDKDEDKETEDGKEKVKVVKPYYLFSCCGQRPGSAGCHSQKHSTALFRRTLMSYGPPSSGTTLHLSDDDVTLSSAFLKRLTATEWKRSHLGREPKRGTGPNATSNGELPGPGERFPLSKSIFDEYVVPLIEGRPVPKVHGKLRTANTQLRAIGAEEVLRKAALKYPLLCWRGDQFDLHFDVDEEKMKHTARCPVKVELDLEVPETDQWRVVLETSNNTHSHPVQVFAVLGTTVIPLQPMSGSVRIVKKGKELKVGTESLSCSEDGSDTIRVVLDKGGDVSVTTEEPPIEKYLKSENK